MRTFLILAPLRSCTERPGRLTFSPGFPSVHPGQLTGRRTIRPSTDSSRRVHSRAKSYFAHRPRGATPEVTFRPRGFTPPRRLSPHRNPRACCIPLPVLGFAGFPPWRRRPKVGGARAFSPRRTHTPRRNPRVTAAPRHRGRCPLAVRHRASRALAPPHCWVGVCTWVGRGASASRPCSITGSRHRSAPLLVRASRSFLGFVPLQGPSRWLEILLPPSLSAVTPRGFRR